MPGTCTGKLTQGSGGAAVFPAYAAVDLGTHNCRLLIGSPGTDGSVAVLDALARPVRLGEGLASTGRLGDPGMQRAIDALDRCARRIARRRVCATRAVATEACRRATNAAEFLARVRAACGLAVEPISAREESRLTLAGCAGLMEPGHHPVLLFDIGGGSTEVVWADRRSRHNPAPLACLSLPTGVVDLTERYGSDRIDEASFSRMVDAAHAALARFDAAYGIAETIAAGRVQMIGTSGTVTTLAAVSLGIGRYRRTKVDGTVIAFDEIARLTGSLARTDWQTRAAIPSVGPARADLVVAGCAILTAICRLWPVGRVTVADRGLREGLILAMHEARTARGLSTHTPTDTPTGTPADTGLAPG
ncbi:MAG: Ppx/GppA phosphatase family protein [Rhodospirillales bacterium]